MKQILSGILNILEPKERLKLLTLTLFDLVMGILDVAFLGMTLLVINFYIKDQSPAVISFLPATLLNRGSLLLIGVFLLLFCSKNWLGYITTKHQQHFFYSISSRLSKRNVEAYLTSDYLRFVNVDSSVLVRQISQQPIEFSNSILNNLQQIASQGILILVTVTGILFWQPGLFVMLFLLLMPPVVLLANFIRSKLKAIRLNTRMVSQKTIQHLNETLAGYIESNVYRKDELFVNRYYNYQLQLNNNIATQQTLQGLTSRLVEVFAILGFFILIAVNELSSGTPAVSLFTIGVFMAAAYKIIPGIVKILNSAGQIKTYQFTINDLQPEEKAAVVNDETRPITSIKFDQVGFKYNDREVLNGLNLMLSAGSFTGISAASGKGKTTIINLLLGFLQQNTGDNYINEERTDQLQRKAFLNRISYVKQQTFLINDTLLKNITLSDGTCDPNRLEEVIAFCGLGHLIAQYPNAINEQIKENGKNISGGQRQRLMLARALYHDFDLLILDEAFSEMDEASEQVILFKLKALAQQGKMIILITHNNASLEFCDNIISFDTIYA